MHPVSAAATAATATTAATAATTAAATLGPTVVGLQMGSEAFWHYLLPIAQKLLLELERQLEQLWVGA